MVTAITAQGRTIMCCIYVEPNTREETGGPLPVVAAVTGHGGAGSKDTTITMKMHTFILSFFGFLT